jgi:ketosteroid isomerase-like protein
MMRRPSDLLLYFASLNTQRGENMKKVFLLVLLLAFTGTFAWAQCSDSAKKELEAFDRAWGAASLGGDRSQMMAIYADDYIGLPDGQNKTSAINSAMAAYEAEKASPSGEKVTHEHYMIACTPNSATITHRNTIWVPKGEGGHPETLYSRSVHVLEKRGGKWQVVSNAGGSLDDYATLWYLEQDWNNAIHKRDKAWFEHNYSRHFGSVSSQTGQVMNRAQDIADTIDDKSTYDLVETSDMQIRIDGNTAIVNGIFRMRGKDEKGAPVDRRSRYTDTWIKRDGRWQVMATAGTIIP